MTPQTCLLIGAPVDSGKARQGCLMGPDAYRVAGLTEALSSLGHSIEDLGNLTPTPVAPSIDLPAHLHAPDVSIGWTQTLVNTAENAMRRGLPIFLGGDHSLSLGSVAGVANHAASRSRPQFVLWLDAHSDFHTPQSTTSGNLHGTPLAYVTGQKGFSGFPKIQNPIPQDHICIIGLRSVDPAEREILQKI